MAVNSDKPDRWKQDIAASVDLYNDWFLQFAPETYRQERIKATEQVEAMLERIRSGRIRGARRLARMMLNLSIEQVIKMAPDPTATAAGKTLVGVKHWRELGRSAALRLLGLFVAGQYWSA